MNKQEEKEMVTRAKNYAKRNLVLAEKLISDGKISENCMVCGISPYESEFKLFAFSLNGNFEGLYCAECLAKRHEGLVGKKLVGNK